ncbi:MAG TPA: ABC transporter permease [Candidatus Acidoferrales bacterium]|nr:ABC transporter permease [Candidatus Acidoferrales bacterium]
MTRRKLMLEELDAEIREHIEHETQDNIGRGMSPHDARIAARRKFGNVGRVREDARAVWTVVWLEQLLQDARYALRTLRKSPGFTAIAVLTLALGIGANTAIFSIVYAVLLKPLPYPHADELVSLTMAEPREGIPSNGTSYDNFREWSAQNHVFTALAGIQSHDLTLNGLGEPASVETAVVTPEMFRLLGVKPLLGRTLLADDGKKGASPVVVLNENLWRDRFGANPEVVGTSISLDKRFYTVVGVMPARFRYPPLTSSEHAWIPLAQDPVFGPWMDQPDGHWLRVIARIKAGVSLAQAQAEMDTIGARLAQKSPQENAGWVIRVVPLQQQMAGNIKTALLVLFGCVGLVLLIACANVSNLLLARATSRTKEIALRVALGAGQARIVRQLLTESAVLGLAGGMCGVLLAHWGVRGIASMLPANLPQAHSIRVDGSVITFALVLSIMAAMVFGLAPTLFAAKANLQGTLKEDGARSGESAVRRFARGFLATVEVALAMIVLAGAGLLARSFLTLTSVKPGFDVQRLTWSGVQLPLSQYSKPEQWAAFCDELLRRLRAQPGMHDTATGVPLPLSDGFISLHFDIAGRPPLRPGTLRDADYAAVSTNYFDVMGIPLLHGRWFNEQDRASARRVAVISETLAQMYFVNQNPIGHELIFGLPPDTGTPREIIGIVGDVHDVGLNQAGPMMYVPFAQSPFWLTEIVVKSNLSRAGIAANVREQIHALDKDLPVENIEAMTEAVDASVQQPRFRTTLLGLFGAIALVLAAAGIYGVMSYSVSRRIHEIGIRMALGASPSSILRLVLTESARFVGIGLLAGIAAALSLSRLFANLLFAVRPTDPATFAAVAALLIAVALAASYFPTRRAMRVDPLEALRHE